MKKIRIENLVYVSITETRYPDKVILLGTKGKDYIEVLVQGNVAFYARRLFPNLDPGFVFSVEVGEDTPLKCPTSTRYIGKAIHISVGE